MFKNPFSFKGRIRRLEYGLSYLMFIGGLMLTSSLYEFPIPDQISETISIIALIPLAWFILAQCTKRCHDRNNSGWYQFIPFYRFFLFFLEGDIGDNNYGTDPKVEHHHTSSDVIDDELMRYND
ncbi:MAG: DUF805 domain-containing protein [Bacteroidetes bacterium]|nr:DUF805 domain-containing protein [Bacteroidota bacterium]